MSVTFARPETLDEAFTMLDDEEALLLAGGQSLVLLMNIGLLYPEKLVSVAHIPDLQGVAVSDGVLDLGALTTHDVLANHPAVLQHFPAAANMFARIGNVRVRSSGTLGGNLVHADPAQDPPVMLTVLDAQAVVAGPAGQRRIPVQDVALGPFVAAIEHNEIITRVHVPLVEPNISCSYLKFLSGTQDDYATVSVAAKIATDETGKVTDARLAAGAVGPTVVPLLDAAETLHGHRIDDEDVLDMLKTAVREAVSPMPDRRGSADYKREMTAVVAARAVRACGDQTTGDAVTGGQSR